MANKLKIPPLTNQTKILSFDLETNGLHGQAFAIGAVVIDARGNTHSQFSGRCNIEGSVDGWVKMNVLPVIDDMPIAHKSYVELREGFWEWYKQNEPKSDYVLVNNGYPVEYRFLLDCQEADLENRYWDHPFPILELNSLLLQIGKNDNKEFSYEFTAKFKRKHHPLDDAIVATLTAFKALRQSSQLQ